MLDKMTEKPRGFGFVVFQDQGGLDAAIGEMHNTLLEEKKISVTEAVPQEKMPR
jgi:RNA recognition motif-containing protein